MVRCSFVDTSVIHAINFAQKEVLWKDENEHCSMATRVLYGAVVSQCPAGRRQHVVRLTGQGHGEEDPLDLLG